MRALIPALAAVLLLPACGPSAQESMTLAEASATTTFASVEQLGPHRSTVTVVREDRRSQGAPLHVEEEVELTWQDWDHFQVRRRVDGEVERETLVYDGRAYVRESGRWEERPDAEPHRVQLRTTWNTWDEVLGPHLAHMALVPDGRDEVDGRPRTRMAVQLRPEAERPRPTAWGFQPTALAGTVWIDEATAVRVEADVTAAARRQDVERTVHLTLATAGIGQDQGLAPP